MKINDNFEKLPDSYLFSEVAHKLSAYRQQHPDADIIRMDIGDVTLPLAPCVVDAMHRAVDDLASSSTFHGYGPEQGYQSLREAIAVVDYRKRGIDISENEIFISDGAKSDLGNLGDILSGECVIAVAEPGYPVYTDTTVMAGRAGDICKHGKWSGIVYLNCSEETGFKPEVPKEHADVVILCSPSNPTGAALTETELKEWVEYAKREKALIIYDSAYEAYVRDEDIPRSIYEIDGAKEVAIEVRSFSKTAGFTGLRCGYTVVPETLTGTDSANNKVALNKLWNRRQTTKFNGASYISQRGAEALYTPEGRNAIKEQTDCYLENAALIRESMQQAGYTVFGGENSPYVWIKGKNGENSWELFNRMLDKYHISCTPGIGFGISGDGYIRLTGFNTLENTRRAMQRLLSAT